MLGPQSLDEIEVECAKFPAGQRQSAIIAALRIAQAEHRWLSSELIEYVGVVIGVPAVRAYEVASFYSMFQLQPVGENVVRLCTNIACMLRGCEQIQQHIENKLNIKMGETSTDGKFTLQQVECLCACAGAPMMQVNRDYHENLTPERIDAILEKY